MRVRLGAAVLAALAVAACGSSNSPKPASSPAGPTPVNSNPSAGPSATGADFFDSFDDNHNDWPTRSDPDGSRLTVTGGEYDVRLPAGDIRYIRPAALADRKDLQSSVSVTGTIKILEGSNYSVGLACRMSPQDKQYYIGRVFGDGTSAIVRREKDKGEHILRSSRANPITLQQGAPLQIVLLCGKKPDGSMTLALSINDRIAVQADDPKPLPENPAGIYAVAGLKTPTSSFTFDNIQVSPYTP
jgi:hypothetical protein